MPNAGCLKASLFFGELYEVLSCRRHGGILLTDDKEIRGWFDDFSVNKSFIQCYNTI